MLPICETDVPHGPEQIQTKLEFRSEAKKTRGRNKSTIRLIEAMRNIADEMHPITGRGIGYKLFSAKLIDSMLTNNMSSVYRALKIAREDGTIPWDWIIDETRDLEMVPTWMNGSELANSFFYRRDLWQGQPVTVEVWSEKGTVRGVLWPVLAELGVGFRVMPDSHLLPVSTMFQIAGMTSAR